MDWVDIISLSGVVLVVVGVILRTRKQRTLFILPGLLFLIAGFVLVDNWIGASFALVVLIWVLRRYYLSRKSIRLIKIIEVTHDDNYLQEFLEYYRKQLYNYFPIYQKSESDRVFFLIREMNVAGILIAKTNNKEMFVELDFIKPEYRDFEIGNYIYNQNTGYFKKMGISKILTKSYHKKHSKYLLRMGFVQEIINDQLFFIKKVD
jgi:hypothetical protein